MYLHAIQVLMVIVVHTHHTLRTTDLGRQGPGLDFGRHVLMLVLNRTPCFLSLYSFPL